MDPISSYPPLPTTDANDNGNNKHGVAERVREKLDTAATTVSSKAGDLAHKAGDMAARAKDSARETASRVQERAMDAGRSSRQMVVDNPIRSMAIGLGVGVVLGFFLSRSMR
jgi:ElaB/YqjD/DUF883 family membrane-anchored ribosome-binding protein